MPTTRTSKILLITIFLAALALLAGAAAQKSFWEDEAFTARIAQNNLDGVLEATARDVHPPLYLLLVSQWGALFGYEELGLRSLSIFFALVTLILAYKLAAAAAGPRAGLFTLAVLAFSPLFVMYAHNARYYSMTAAFSLLAVYATYRFQVTRRWPYLLVYVFSGTLLLYLLFAAAAVLLACNLWWLVSWWRERPRSGIIAWLLAQVAVMLLYLPGYRIFATVLEKGGGFPSTLVDWLLEIFKRVGYLGFVFGVGETYSPLNPLAWLGLLLVAALAVIALLRRARKAGLWLALMVLLAVALTNIVISLDSAVATTWQNISYRAFYGLPFLAIVVGVGLSTLRPRSGLAISALLLVVYAAGIGNYFSNRQFIRPIYAVPWRQIFTQIRAQAPPDAVVICNRTDYACPYYAGRFGIERYKPTDWESLAAKPPSELWWLNSNLGLSRYDEDPELAILQQVQTAYACFDIYNYGLQEASIRWIKSALMGQQDYEYRLNVYKFEHLVASGQSTR
jgi:uncharacterized membrane protein